VADLHPGVVILAPLVGTWVGEGSGEYPTIEPFTYREELTIGHTGKPFLTYTQRTTGPDGQPLHAETGYFRVPAPGRIELVVAQPTGITEVDEGTVSVDGGVIDIIVDATSIGLATSAKDVNALSRSFHLDGGDLTYTVRMGAVGQPLQHHLAAVLHRRPQ